MEVAIPHDLGRETARERLRARSHQMGDAIPGGMAEVATDWPSENRMAMSITTMGQVLRGHVDIEDDRMVLFIDLPPALAFMQPMVEGAIRQQGIKLLAPTGRE